MYFTHSGNATANVLISRSVATTRASTEPYEVEWPPGWRYLHLAANIKYRRARPSVCQNLHVCSKSQMRPEPVPTNEPRRRLISRYNAPLTKPNLREIFVLLIFTGAADGERPHKNTPQRRIIAYAWYTQCKSMPGGMEAKV